MKAHVQMELWEERFFDKPILQAVSHRRAVSLLANMRSVVDRSGGVEDESAPLSRPRPARRIREDLDIDPMRSSGHYNYRGLWRYR